jgi:uncharacterized membrane protein
MSRRGRMILAAVFVASLALNIVVAGFLLQRWIDTPARSPQRAAERAATAAIGRLPPEVRDPLLDAVLARQPELDSAIRELRRSRREVRAAMRAEPLDAERVRTALATTRERSAALLLLIDGIIVDKLPGIPAEARAKIPVPGSGRAQEAANP